MPRVSGSARRPRFYARAGWVPWAHRGKGSHTRGTVDARPCDAGFSESSSSSRHTPRSGSAGSGADGPGACGVTGGLLRGRLFGGVGGGRELTLLPRAGGGLDNERFLSESSTNRASKLRTVELQSRPLQDAGAVSALCHGPRHVRRWLRPRYVLVSGRATDPILKRCCARPRWQWCPGNNGQGNGPAMMASKEGWQGGWFGKLARPGWYGQGHRSLGAPLGVELHK